jgi:HupE / UreJ protein
MNRRRLLWQALFVLLLSPLTAHAHLASTSWLKLAVSNATVTGRWEIPLPDLDDVLGLDADDDGQLTWGELRAREADVAAYVLARLSLSADGLVVKPCATKQLVCERSDGGYAVLDIRAEAAQPIRELRLAYRLFFDRDLLHRGLVNVTGTGGDSVGTAAVLSPEHSEAAFAMMGPARAVSLAAFVREGVHHIWTGYDHLLFLLALLLPAVLWRGPDGWRPQASFALALRHVLQVVTAFTLAHSLTLALAAFDLVRLPSRLVESCIAVSIAVAALANFRGRANRTAAAEAARHAHKAPRDLAGSPWVMPFFFGLIHGFGFAGALGELGLRRGALAVPLVGFNLGVELGQLAWVVAFLPLAFAGRASRFYRFVAVPLGSAGILLLAGGWFVERAFAVKFLPF